MLKQMRSGLSTMSIGCQTNLPITFWSNRFMIYKLPHSLPPITLSSGILVRAKVSYSNFNDKQGISRRLKPRALAQHVTYWLAFGTWILTLTILL